MLQRTKEKISQSFCKNYSWKHITTYCEESYGQGILAPFFLFYSIAQKKKKMNEQFFFFLEMGSNSLHKNAKKAYMFNTRTGYSM